MSICKIINNNQINKSKIFNNLTLIYFYKIQMRIYSIFQAINFKIKMLINWFYKVIMNI
jgi:hypothetical protein